MSIRVTRKDHDIKIGLRRAEEARVFDSMAGYHPFHEEETQREHGSFEVFFEDGKNATDEDGEPLAPGLYWQACFPSCLPDGEATGPFGSSSAAHEDADEWSTEYDEAE